MSISEFLKLRNAIFFLAEQQAHAQVKKVQIKPSFILEIFDLCKWAFPIF